MLCDSYREFCAEVYIDTPLGKTKLQEKPIGVKYNCITRKFIKGFTQELKTLLDQKRVLSFLKYLCSDIL